MIVDADMAALYRHHRRAPGLTDRVAAERAHRVAWFCDSRSVVGVALLVLLAATALLVAASLRLDGPVPSLLAAYVCFVAETTATTAALSPFRGVTQTRLGEVEVAVFAAALVVWWRRGRPGLAMPRTAAAAWRALRDPIIGAFVLVATAVFAYEFLLVVASPPNNWDALSYHLTRVAMWLQHGGIYWVPDAPTGRINEFQPVAEQEILALFVTTGSAALSALPQFLAELAIVGAVYSSARSLGHELRGAVCAALLFATLPLVALESITAQNDLVAASFPAVAVAFLLRGGQAGVVLAGLAVALGLGVKLTTALALPVVVLLAVRCGRRVAVRFGGATLAGFVLVGCWGYVLNLVETGHVLGYGDGRVENTMSPNLTDAVSVFVAVIYRFSDLPGFGTWLTWGPALVGVDVALALIVIAWLRRRPVRPRLRRALWIALPLCTPALALLVAGALHGVVRVTGLPVGGSSTAFLGRSFTWKINRFVKEDFAAFGPLGLLILGVSAVTVIAAIRGSGDRRRLALALSIPVFIALLAANSRYNPFLSRFVLVAVALSVPLLAGVLARTEAALSVLAVAVIAVWLALDQNEAKRFNSGYGHPWQLTRSEAAWFTWQTAAGEAVSELDQDTESDGLIGAVMGGDDPTYLLFGPNLKRRIRFLSPATAVAKANEAEYLSVVIGHVDQSVSDAFARSGWRVQSLGGYWSLAIRT